MTANTNPDAAPESLRAAQADVAFPPTATWQRHRTSHGGRQVDRSKALSPVAARYAVLCLESSNCWNVPPAAIQQASCSPAPVRTAQDAWGSGISAGTSDGTPGAPGQGTALQAGARISAK